jgi:hypothetical protein
MKAPFKTQSFLKWNITHKFRPEPGYAIVWISTDGSQIEGCMTIEEHQGVVSSYREYYFLPLMTYDDRHMRDIPIDYIPSMWRYK